MNQKIIYSLKSLLSLLLLNFNDPINVPNDLVLCDFREKINLKEQNYHIYLVKFLFYFFMVDKLFKDQKFIDF